MEYFCVAILDDSQSIGHEIEVCYPSGMQRETTAGKGCLLQCTAETNSSLPHYQSSKQQLNHA